MGRLPALAASMGSALEDETAAARAGDREWVEVTFADPARATEWIAQQGVLAGHVQVLCAHRGQAALRLYLTARQRRALPGRGAAAGTTGRDPSGSH